LRSRLPYPDLLLERRLGAGIRRGGRQGSEPGRLRRCLLLGALCGLACSCCCQGGGAIGMRVGWARRSPPCGTRCLRRRSHRCGWALCCDQRCRGLASGQAGRVADALRTRSPHRCLACGCAGGIRRRIWRLLGLCAGLVCALCRRLGADRGGGRGDVRRRLRFAWRARIDCCVCCLLWMCDAHLGGAMRRLCCASCGGLVLLGSWCACIHLRCARRRQRHAPSRGIHVRGLCALGLRRGGLSSC
jgi:hypothetical protein